MECRQARGMAGALPSPLPVVLLIGFGYYPISSAALLFGQLCKFMGIVIGLEGYCA